MSTIAPPRIRFLEDAFVVELSAEYSHLYESLLEPLAILPVLAKSIEPARLVIDMTNVEFIGSATIGNFVTVAKIVNERGGWLKLANSNQFCGAAIGLSGLKAILPCVESVAVAVNES